MSIVKFCRGEIMDRGVPSITRRGRGRAALLAAGLAAVLGASASPAHAADGQWGFEQVTPVEKGAGSVAGVDTFTAAPDGGSIIHTSMGAYEGVPTESVPLYVRYLGVRGPDSWVNHPLDPTYNIGTGAGAAIYNIMGTLAASPDLSHVMVTSKDALTPGATQGGSNHYIRNGRTGALTLIATTTNQALTSVVHILQGQKGVKFVANDGRAALFLSTVSADARRRGEWRRDRHDLPVRVACGDRADAGVGAAGVRGRRAS